jgi:hypothetical protein
VLPLPLGDDQLVLSALDGQQHGPGLLGKGGNLSLGGLGVLPEQGASG